MKAAVLTDDPNHGERLRKWLGGSLEVMLCPHPPASSEARAWIEETAPVLCVVDVDKAATFDGLQVIERLGQRRSAMTLVAMGTQPPAEVLLSAMRVGASDFIDMGASESESGELAVRLMRRARRGSGAGGERWGAVSLVMSAVPYEGLAFLGAHLGLAMHQRLPSGERCLLLDLAYPYAASLLFLDIKQEFTLHDCLADISRCDETLVSTAFARHDSGLFLLSQPEDQVAPDFLDAEPLGSLLDVLRGYFSQIVVVADPAASLSALLMLLDTAEHALLLTDPSILKTRRSDGLLQALRAHDADLSQVKLVVDSYQRRLGLSPEKVERLLGLPLAATLGGNVVTHAQARNAGRSLFQMAPRDPYAKAVAELARGLTESEQGEPVRQRGFLQRMFG